MLQHNDGIEHADIYQAEEYMIAEEKERNNVERFGLYNATVQAVVVGVDPRAQEIAAEAIKDWFLRHHPQEQHRLGHITIDTWDRMARNRKRGFDEFMAQMGNTFQRRDITHARSRALPETTADSHNVKWTAELTWQKGTYHDNTSCFFTGNRVYLNGMVSQGVTMLGFHDMEQGVGTGRVFVSPTWPSLDTPETPNGLLLWGGYGHLDDLGWMPVKPAADVLIAISKLPYRTSLTDNVTWLGHQEPSEQERRALRGLPSNYNGFPQIEEPAAFDCITCHQNFPNMTSRIVKARHEQWDEQAYAVARELERSLNARVQDLANSEERFTPTGRQSLPWARRYQALLNDANEANIARRRLGNPVITEDITCMECHYAETLPAR